MRRQEYLDWKREAVAVARYAVTVYLTLKMIGLGSQWVIWMLQTGRLQLF